MTIVVPSSLLGVLALSVNIFDYGEQQSNPDPTLPTEGGTIVPRSFVYSATYATSLGSYVTAGLTYKLIQFRIDCTGPCPDIAFAATTSALDLGAQFMISKSVPLVIGIAGHQQRSKRRACVLRQPDCIETVHSRHCEVGEQDIIGAVRL